MLWALGVGDQIVGVSHECDFPPEARTRPVMVRPAINLEGLTQREIDAAVSARLREGKSLYVIDEDLLRRAAPDLIVTQDLCQVCAPSGNELGQALKALPHLPEVVPLSPRTLEEILDNVLTLGTAVGRASEARLLVEEYREQLDHISNSTTHLPPVR